MQTTTTPKPYGYRPDGSPIYTQREACLCRLRAGHTVTTKDARSLWSAERLSAIIHDLRRKLEDEGGHEIIVTRYFYCTNRHGHKSGRYGEYHLERVEE